MTISELQFDDKHMLKTCASNLHTQLLLYPNEINDVQNDI